MLISNMFASRSSFFKSVRALNCYFVVNIAHYARDDKYYIYPNI